VTRTQKIAAAVAAVLFTACTGLYVLAFHAPVFLLMPHAPRDSAALFDSRPALIAHRGHSGIAPENTLAAFKEAAAGGFWVELDVALCKSGEIIVIHDDTVDRTTNGSGAVADLTLAELVALDAGSWFDAPYNKETLPTLDEAFATIPMSSVILVELKTDDDKVALPQAVAKAIATAGRQDRVMVISFDPFMLEQLKLAAPDILRGQLVGDYSTSDLAWYEKRALRNLAMTDKVQQDAVLFQHDLLNPTLVGRLKGLGYPVFAWTVNEPADIARMKDLGIDGIISNYPDRGL